VGETLTEVPVTVPTPEIDNAVAPLLVQDRVEDPPLVIEVGLAVKEEMVGAEPAGVTVTVVLAVTEPELLDAVKV
jgi:hypothetical protein